MALAFENGYTRDMNQTCVPESIQIRRVLRILWTSEWRSEDIPSLGNGLMKKLKASVPNHALVNHNGARHRPRWTSNDDSPSSVSLWKMLTDASGERILLNQDGRFTGATYIRCRVHKLRGCDHSWVVTMAFARPFLVVIQSKFETHRKFDYQLTVWIFQLGRIVSWDLNVPRCNLDDSIACGFIGPDLRYPILGDWRSLWRLALSKRVWPFCEHWRVRSSMAFILYMGLLVTSPDFTKWHEAGTEESRIRRRPHISHALLPTRVVTHHANADSYDRRCREAWIFW